MNQLNRNTAKAPAAYPERILQFGGGNFLRGFVDWILDEYNEKTGNQLGVLVVKPTERGDYQSWRDQDGLYHVLTKGIRDGELVDESRLVNCVTRIIHPYRNWEAYLASAENPDLRYIISNTTESGIRVSDKDQKSDSPPHEFPAKLTLWLYHRYQYFQGAADKGCILIPTELLNDNGDLLKECILQNTNNWQLEPAFAEWIKTANVFCNTLVDRIVPGVGEGDLQKAWQAIGFRDDMITQGEPYHLWAIEAPSSVRTELPLDNIGLNIVYTDDLAPFRTIKVRILNGAHTSMVPVGYLYGLETVRETVEHEVMGDFVRQVIFDEIIPTLDIDDTILQKFANDVLDRFKNPFIRHQLISIALNSVSKFKTRVLPSLLEYVKRKQTIPAGMTLSLACTIRFYKGEIDGKAIPIKDEPWAVDFLQDCWKGCNGSRADLEALVRRVLTWEKAWETDLTSIPGLKDKLVDYLVDIETKGVPETVKTCLS